REYVEVEGKSFAPSELGYSIKNKLEENFPNIMNVKFTAELEDKLDKIAEGNMVWTDVLGEFYQELSTFLERYEAILEEESKRIITSDVKCKCSDTFMLMKTGRFGKYLECPDEECAEKITLKGIKIPESNIQSGEIFVKDQIIERDKGKEGVLTDIKTEDGTLCLLKIGRFGSYLESSNFKEDGIRISIPGEIKKKLMNSEINEIDGVIRIKWEMDKIEEEENAIIREAGVCEKCGKPFKLNRGRWGKFLSCTGYPECKNIRKLPKSN
ncbi:MAG: DNA topoisomerase, partial [Fusobacteriaceae bacterium]